MIQYSAPLFVIIAIFTAQYCFIGESGMICFIQMLFIVITYNIEYIRKARLGG